MRLTAVAHREKSVSPFPLLLCVSASQKKNVQVQQTHLAPSPRAQVNLWIPTARRIQPLGVSHDHVFAEFAGSMELPA